MAGYASNLIQTGILRAIFNNVSTSSSGVTVTGTSTALWIALHTADPTAAGAQNASETSYGGYLRVLTDRSTASTGWTVTGNSPATANPLAAITFATCTTSTTAIITNFSVGLSSSGASSMWFSGPVTQNISINTGVTPSLTTGTGITLD
jgi:hypothetical protein